MENTLSILLIISVISGIFLVIRNVFKQREAERHLEILLLKHKDLVLKDLRYFETITKENKTEVKKLKSKNESLNNYIHNESLLIALKNVIGRLEDEDRIVMEKSFGKKSDNDQQRYAHKIFVECGFGKNNSNLRLEPVY
jgi:isochorismate hydrolase